MTEHTDDTTGAAADAGSAGSTPFAPPAAGRGPLRRSRHDRVLAGVATGLARWLGIDPVLVRVLFVVLAIFGGSGILLYVIGWLFIPLEGEQRSEAEQLLDRHRLDDSSAKLPPWLVIPAVIIGVIVLGSIVSAGPWGGWWSTGGWILLLTCGGVVLWLMNRDGLMPGATAASPPQPVAEPAPAGFARGGAGEYPDYGEHPTLVAPAPPSSPPPSTPPPPPAPAKPMSYLGAATLSLAIIVVGVLSALSIGDVVAIEPAVIMAAGLGVLGLGLIVGTLFGRALWLLSLAIPLAVATVLVALVPTGISLGDGIGSRTWRPATVVTAVVPHKLSIGEAQLDLSQLQPPADPAAVIPVRVELGIGELTVVLPSSMNVRLDASVGAGELRIAGRPEVSGLDNQVQVLLPAATGQPAPTIELTTITSIGTTEVSRA